MLETSEIIQRDEPPKVSVRDIFNGIFSGIVSFRLKRIDSRRFWPLLVFFLLILVTISHEANYAASFEIVSLRFMGWPYAIAINIAIFVSEYFMGWKGTNRYAWWTFIASTLGSGLMNVAYILPWDKSGWNEFFAWIYALLPTILIVFIGFLSSAVNKMAITQERRWETDAEKNERKYTCFCGDSFPRSIDLAQHTRGHIKELRSLSISPLESLQYLKETYPDAKEYPTIGKIKQWTGEKQK
jgi:hypothetical protein